MLENQLCTSSFNSGSLESFHFDPISSEETQVKRGRGREQEKMSSELGVRKGSSSSSSQLHRENSEDPILSPKSPSRSPLPSRVCPPFPLLPLFKLQSPSTCPIIQISNRKNPGLGTRCSSLQNQSCLTCHPIKRLPNQPLPLAAVFWGSPAGKKFLWVWGRD